MSGRLSAAEREEAPSRLRAELGRLFRVLLVLFGIAILVQNLISAGLPPSRQMLYSWGFLLLVLVPIGWFTWQQRLPPASFGLTTRNWRKSLFEGAVVSAVIVAAGFAWRAVARPAGAPIVTWGSLASYSRPEFAAFFALYGPHSFLQEFIGRGVIQGSLARVLPQARAHVPIVLTSALFGVFHFYVSWSFAAITFVVSLLFGAIYLRHGTLIGVTLVHLALGCMSIATGLN